jgi:hypothetical protein
MVRVVWQFEIPVCLYHKRISRKGAGGVKQSTPGTSGIQHLGALLLRHQRLCGKLPFFVRLTLNCYQL